MNREERIRYWEKDYGIDYTHNYSKDYSKEKIIPCIYNVFHKLPLDVFNTIMDFGVYFFIMNDVGTVRFNDTNRIKNTLKTFKKFTIFLNGIHLRNKPKDDIEWVIAHELSHIIQSIFRAKNYDEVECKCKKGDEREADRIVEKWGFPMPERWKKIREEVYKKELLS